jgi:hypothetical protein
MAANGPARLKPIDIECVVYTAVDHEIEPGAVVVRLGCHLAAGFSQVRVIRLADKDQSRCSQNRRAAAARRMIAIAAPNLSGRRRSIESRSTAINTELLPTD